MEASIPAIEAARPAHPLSFPPFRRLWIGSMVSLLGDQLYLVALPWLVYQLTGSSVALGTILMTAAIPRALLMLLGGAVSDRHPPRTILIGTAAARAILVGVLAALSYLGQIRLWNIYILAAAFGIADAFSFPAGQALLPSIVPVDQLSAANSLFQGGAQVAALLGPALAGIIVKFWSVSAAMMLDALSFLFVIVPLLRLAAKALPAARGNMAQTIREGIQYVLRDHGIRALTLLSAIMNFCVAGPIAVGLATLGKFQFHSSTAFGNMISSFGGGALAGTVLSGVLRARSRRGRILTVLAFLLGLCFASIGWLHTLLPILCALVIIGIVAGYTNMMIVVWLQSRVDRSYLGRVMGLLLFAAVGLIPVSQLVAGLLAGIHPSLLFEAAGVLIAVSALGFGVSRGARDMD